MHFLCFITSADRTVPHMEPLEAKTPDEARVEALKLMSDHARAVRAEICRGGQVIEVVSPPIGKCRRFSQTAPSPRLQTSQAEGYS